MSIGALCAGFVIHAALGFPGFEPIAVLGGVFWTIGVWTDLRFDKKKQNICIAKIFV
jgi:hypothetical protein